MALPLRLSGPAPGAASSDDNLRSSAKVVLDNISKRYRMPGGGEYAAVENVSLAVAPGSFVAIVGPSGCGKSTLLRMVAGLAEPSSGQVLLDGRPVKGIQKGKVGFLFQQDALLPWMSVAGNVALGLTMQGVRGAERKDRVAEWLGKVGLTPFADRYPAQLSGGMRKRTAIAQTLVCEPDLILMDEPFTFLDAQTRFMMESDLLALCDDGSKTILFVTHDLDEAIGMSDVVVVMTAGPRSHIRTVEPVDLPRPRDLLGIRGAPRYGELSAYLWQHLHEEVTRAYGRA